MTHLNIPISDDIRAQLEARAKSSGHSSVESYVAALVREDALMIDYGAPDPLRIDARERFESLVMDGMNSPKRELTTADWDQMRRNLIDKHRPSKAG